MASPIVVKRTLSDMKMEDMEYDSKNSSEVSVIAGQAAKKLRKKKKLKTDVDKTPLMMFNEYYTQHAKSFQVDSETGPAHDRLFQLSIVIEGVTYEGQGKTKQQAKQAIAESFLRSVGMWPVVPSNDVIPMGVEFETDGTAVEKNVSNMTPISELVTRDCLNGINPVMVVNQYHPGAKFSIVNEVGRAHDKVFTSQLIINDKIYEGCGHSKKAANGSCASKALFDIYGVLFSKNNTHLSEEDLKFVLPQTVADRIGEAVEEKYAEMTSTAEESDSRKKVLAGIVKTIEVDGEIIEMNVISLGTGTKCISGGNISDSGSAINDCHGEVIARRGFCQFLYNQLDLCVKNKAKLSCLQKKKNGLYAIKDGVDFHLYINTAPCGDARLFSPQEKATNVLADDHPQRRTRGLLRTKIENGEGTVPIKQSGVVQTWDGILQGERLLTMSCSDKISKWNVVGLQGALLSHFLEPVYLTSVVLGNLYNFQHLTRALYKRIDDLQELPSLYRLNTHLVNGISILGSRMTGKSSGLSFNWSDGQENLECINEAKGKVGDETSRLSKSALYARFQLLWKKLKRSQKEPVSYQEAKSTAIDYQRAQLVLKKAYHARDLGLWVCKPAESDGF